MNSLVRDSLASELNESRCFFAAPEPDLKWNLLFTIQYKKLYLIFKNVYTETLYLRLYLLQKANSRKAPDSDDLLDRTYITVLISLTFNLAARLHTNADLSEPCVKTVFFSALRPVNMGQFWSARILCNGGLIRIWKGISARSVAAFASHRRPSMN